MSEGHHDLAHEFPEYRDRIGELKNADAHFSRLAAEYHGVCKELHQVEAQIETPSDQYVEQLKLKRLHLKDELHAILRA